jgi:hypothetical protein
MKRRTAEEKKLADDAYLLREWRRYRAERLEEALAGVHHDLVARVMQRLENLKSARELVDAMLAEDWTAVDADTRAMVLAQIDSAIVALRERQGLPPFDDPLPGAPDNAFMILRRLFESFPLHAGKPPERSGKTVSKDHVKQ